MENRLNRLRKSMEESAFKQLSFSEKMRREVHQQINRPNESEEMITLAILQLLHTEKTGYELTGLLRARGFRKFEGNEGFLYTFLHRLEQKGWIVSAWKEDGTKVYLVGDKGKRYLLKQEKSIVATRNSIKGLLEE
ncbi:PadR family transcriptional regulator [Bacillus sp. ISL-35]|uniref:PadR family transcriptional regulator n=1 Tax=Bacillus sp. ISL-35 TaxID=2819122 RepID=UPI001BE93B60|nr:PadR family transcriptional regulator [Bacillus sp. ISL-35]MBT2681790.1 PadR family transcriptional regulator [Bacillus sp. ISL-35]MBT2706087.1 PadR family transcriptional regulator [Chryseobacterium sp. ISL-80]